MILVKGSQYGDWTVDEHFTGTYRGKVRCVCACGQVREVRVDNLSRGLSTGCGCAKARKTGDRRRKHGAGYSDYRYRLWRSIKNKCFCETHRDWRYYGGRGITMHSTWVDDFSAFAEYLDSSLGSRPKNHTLDRIDNEGDYVPGNLRWATRQEQALNRRDRWRIRE